MSALLLWLSFALAAFVLNSINSAIWNWVIWPFGGVYLVLFYYVAYRWRR